MADTKTHPNQRQSSPPSFASTASTVEVIKRRKNMWDELIPHNVDDYSVEELQLNDRIIDESGSFMVAGLTATKINGRPAVEIRVLAEPGALLTKVRRVEYSQVQVNAEDLFKSQELGAHWMIKATPANATGEAFYPCKVSKANGDKQYLVEIDPDNSGFAREVLSVPPKENFTAQLTI